jgi:HAD superfamily hydrolase (TIGR01549 family)
MTRYAVAVFDLDGTLLDSDQALIDPFLALGAAESDITFGHVLEHECRRLGIEMQAYLDAYDTTSALAFAGVEEMLGELTRWAVCSNKRGDAGRAELARLGWTPEVALFADSFHGGKTLGPVAEAMGIEPREILFVGDTEHDLTVATEAGAGFVFAGWNERRTVPSEEVVVLRDPAEVIGWLR